MESSSRLCGDYKNVITAIGLLHDMIPLRMYRWGPEGLPSYEDNTPIVIYCAMYLM